MDILGWISGLFTPVTNLIKEFHLSDGDRMKLENELAKIQADASAKMVELEEAKLKLQGIEATSANWLVAGWRPACSVVMVVIILAASFGFAHPNEQFYSLAQWFLVGYTGARTIDKINVPGIIEKVMKK